MKKYGVEIQTVPNTDFTTAVGWDALYDPRREAESAAQRAAAKFHNARVFAIEAPAYIDHLYRSLCDPNDTTSMY